MSGQKFSRSSCQVPAMALLFVAVLMLAATTLANAQTETLIHVFQSTNLLDGAVPLANLVADSRGALYGTTPEGGKHGFGSVYKLVPPATHGAPWKEDILYSFTGGADGGNPWVGGLLLTKSGLIYGTARTGGSSNSGVVYQLTPGQPWSETVLYSFTDGKGGGLPSSGVILDSKGALYGMTFHGGVNNQGVVYRLSPPSKSGTRTETVLHAFKGGASDGYLPLFGLTFDSTGALYGATEAGGPDDSGCVFKLTPGTGGWTESILYFFNGGTDAGGPNSGVVFDSTGALYGSTAGNGVQNGNIYQLTPSGGGAWTENILHAFTGSPNDGAVPNGVIIDSTGALYGTTSFGGAFDTCCNGAGTIFSLSPPLTQGGSWTEQIVYSFQGGSDGKGPDVPLLLLDGTFYGVTNNGGKPNLGTVFSFTP